MLDVKEKKRMGWAHAQGPAILCFHVLVQNSEEAKNSKFNFGLLGWYKALFLKVEK